MDKGHSMGTNPMVHTGAMTAVVELMQEMWGLLSEEEKKKVMALRIDVLTQLIEAEIANEEKMIEVKKKAVAAVRQVQEMMK